MAAATPANSDQRDPRPFFGRKADLARLLNRAESTGLTAVVARPQEGKTRLLEEARDKLRERGAIVGYAESTGEYSDVLLRALKDAYGHASAAGKLSVLLSRAKANPTGVLAEVSAAILASVLPGQLQRALQLTKRAADEWRSAGLELPKLTYEEALKLTCFLAAASEDRPIVLFLDAWQDCSPVTEAAAPLQRFLDRTEAWPACHFFLGIRAADPCQPAMACLADLERRSPLTEVRRLGPMDLREPSESQCLLAYLEEVVPAARDVEPALTLQLLAGHPGVLHRWLVMKPATLRHLRALAQDAQLYRYPELRDLLRDNCRRPDSMAAFLATLAILPQINDESTWQLLAPVILGDLSADDRLTLLADGVLEAGDSTATIISYGHATRHEAARTYWLRDDQNVLAPVARRAAGQLIPRLAAQANGTDWRSATFAAAMASMLALQEDLRLDDTRLVMCYCAASMYSRGVTREGSDLLLKAGLSAVSEFPNVGPLVAFALVNAHLAAIQTHDSELRIALLEEQRVLAETHPKQPALQRSLAMTLFNATRAAEVDKNPVLRDSLLEELRNLTGSDHGRTAECAEYLGRALLNTLIEARKEDDPRRVDMLLEELRALARSHPTEAAVRESLARALSSMVVRAMRENRPDRRDALLKELRVLADAYPEEPALRRSLAKGIGNVAMDAMREEKPDHCRALLKELRMLAAAHPEEAVLRESLAQALFNALQTAIGRDDPEARSDALLDELRTLASAHPTEPVLREWLAKALVGSHLAAVRKRRDSERHDAVLNELRALQAAHREETTIAQSLAMSLQNALTQAHGSAAERGALRKELRALAHAYPQDIEYRE